MLIEISKWGQTDYRWLEVIQLNEAFWRGGQRRTAIEIRTGLVPSRPIDPTNLALRRPASASSRQDLAANANDGRFLDPSPAWGPEPPTTGQWWKVNLGETREIARVAVHPRAGYTHDWYAAFHLEVSLTGAFAGEQVRVPLETGWDTTRTRGDYGLQRLSGLQDDCVYTFPAVKGRYVRIVADVDQNWVQLQELEVFALTR